MGQTVTNVAVIGAGKMGLPLACVIASNGARVRVADVNVGIVETINAGKAPFDEPGVPELLSAQVAAGRLSATTNNREAIAASDAVIVIVPVLLTEDKHADLSIIESIARDCAASLRRGAMVSFETTLPVGTTRALGAIIERGGLVAGKDFDLVFSPERVKSQYVLRNLSQVPKAVGGGTTRAADRAERFYGDFLRAPIHNVGSLEAAELVKLAGMAYRDVNIALANELAHYASRVGVDFGAIREAANTDGEAALLIPGIGVGGHCTPVYPHFLMSEARDSGRALPLVEQARAINESQPERVLDEVGDLASLRVLILGVAFRPRVKEASYSPAFALRDAIRKRGGVPLAHDPMFSDVELKALGFEPGRLSDAHVLVLNTAHPEYERLDFAELRTSGVRVVVDGRNLWAPQDIRSRGIEYVGVGRPSHDREGVVPTR